MLWGKKAVATGIAAMLLGGGLGLTSAGTAQAAAAKYKCKATASLDAGRPKATSACKKSSKGKVVRKHRAVIQCDQIGHGGHETTWTLRGDWVSPGKKSTVKCGFKNILRGFRVETK